MRWCLLWCLALPAFGLEKPDFFAGVNGLYANEEQVIEGKGVVAIAAWARWVPWLEGMDKERQSSALYVQFKNYDDRPRTLVGIESRRFNQARILLGDIKKGRVQFNATHALTIAAGESSLLRSPYGYIEIRGLTQPLRKDEVIDVYLLFANGERRYMAVKISKFAPPFAIIDHSKHQ